jgi:hypothetical protein
VGVVASGPLLNLLIFTAVYILLPWVRAHGSRPFLLIGFGWLVSTVAFEFLLGLSRGEGLSALLEAYAFKDGNLWPMVLFVATLSPWMVARLRGLF